MLVDQWIRIRTPLLAMLACAWAAACSPAEEAGALADPDGPVTVTILVTEPTAELSMSPLSDGPAKFLMYLPMVEYALEAMNATSDPVAIDSLYREMWPDFQADVPVTFLHPAVRMWASARRLKGLSSPYRGEVVHYAGELWWQEGP